MNLTISNSIRFWLFLTIAIPSIGCSIIILSYMFYNKNRRNAINNHAIILLLFNNLIYELLNIPLFLNYYRLGYVSPATPSLCITWTFIDEAMYTISTIIVAWASIERHILIFHYQWVSTKKRRIFIHFTPILLLVSYVVAFHAAVIIVTSCENTYDYTQEVCGRPLCFHNARIVGTWDNIVNDIIPTLVIVIFSLGLLVRVLRKNRRIRNSYQWGKHRKMTIQLLSISFLYIFLCVPLMLNEFARLCCHSDAFNSQYEETAQFLSYYVIFLLPFVYFVSLMKSSWQLKNILRRWYQRTTVVHPIENHAMPHATQ